MPVYAQNSQQQDSSQACDDLGTEVTSTPVPPQSSEALRVFRAKIESMPKSADTVLIGDSIIDNWKSEKPALGNIWNFGVGGDSPQHILYRLEKANLSKIHPSRVILMAGTNIIAQRGMTGCNVFAGVKKIIEKVHKVWPKSKILAFGILPKGADFKDSDDRRLDFNKRLESYLGAIGGIYIDVDEQQLTCGGYGRAALPKNTMVCYPDQAYVCQNYFTDHVHLNQPGYDILYASLLRRLGSKP